MQGKFAAPQFWTDTVARATMRAAVRQACRPPPPGSARKKGTGGEGASELWGYAPSALAPSGLMRENTPFEHSLRRTPG